jgi:membrane protein
MIYGVLSNVIVLLIEVSIFFYLFFFFAQNVYVNQFFDLLVISELFRLPPKDNKSKLSILHRKLFLNPLPLKAKGLNTPVFKEGDIIYNTGDKSKCIYFVLAGKVMCEKEGFSPIYFEAGESFGEREFVLAKNRTTSAACSENSILLEIPDGILNKLIKTSPDVTKKIMMSLSNR